MKLQDNLKNSLVGKSASIVLLLVNLRNYQKISLDAIKYLSHDLGMPGVYISVNKPYMTIKKTLMRASVDVETMIFIDAITRVSGGNEEKSDSILYLDGPDNLTDFSISITEAVSALDFKEKFLFFDSINTLLVYNNADVVTSFFHFLSSRMRQWGIKGVVIAMDKKSDKELLSQIGQFCDKVIDLGGAG